MSRLKGVLLRVGCAVVLTSALMVWSGPGPAVLVPLVAQAGSEWCDSDPTLLIRTPDGHIVTVYYLTGALGLEHAPALLLTAVSYEAKAVGDETAVTLHVTVPNDALGTGFPTRVKVSAGPAGSLMRYGEATGTSGTAMIVKFRLPIS